MILRLVMLMALGALLAGQRGWDLDERVRERLEALTPNDAEAYFLLAEEISDGAASAEERDLAIRLFTIAGSLDPRRWQRGALLAVEAMTEDPSIRRLIQANLRATGSRGGFLPTPGRGGAIQDEAAEAAFEAISAFRRGDAMEVRRSLAVPGAAARLDAWPAELPGGAVWLSRSADSDRFGPGMLSERAAIETLKIQASLIEVDRLPWSVMLQTSSREPMAVTGVLSLSEIFGIDPGLNRFNEGVWTAE